MNERGILKDPSFSMVQYESTCLDMPVYFGTNVHCREWPPSRTIAKADSGKKNTCEPEAVDIVTGKVQLGIYMQVENAPGKVQLLCAFRTLVAPVQICSLFHSLSKNGMPVTVPIPNF